MMKEAGIEFGDLLDKLLRWQWNKRGENMLESKSRAWVEIDLSKIKHNVEEIRKISSFYDKNHGKL